MRVSNPRRLKRRSIVVWQRLTHIYQMISRFERETLAPFQLTTAQFDVLSHLSRTPGISQRALADRLLVTKGNICGLIDRLEDAGLVERREAPNDRRSFQLFLTQPGNQAFQQAAPVLEERLLVIFSVLNDDELEMLSGFINRLAKQAAIAN